MAVRWIQSGIVVAFASVFATTARAQNPAPNPAKPTRCTLVPQPNTRLSTDTLPNGQQIAFVGGGALFKCPERGITLKGDSAEEYPDREFVIGHVVYDEPRLHLTSDFLTHYPADERIIAAGNVDAKLPSGSSLKGPVAELQRPLLPARPRRKLIANQRPTISVVEKDSTGKPMDPMTVVANNVLMDGDSLIYAGGQVIITRPNLSATADSAAIDETKETMQLMRNPQITGKKDRPFSLSGDVINLYSKDRKLNRVIARANAKAVSDSMTITSDTIDLRVKNDLLDHAYAWGATNRARAVSPSQNMLADSLDIAMPGQRVQIVRALRKAFADSKPDTLKFRVEKADSIDWLQGDTIVAHFDTAATRDTSKTPKVKTLVATGKAKALYHLAPSDTTLRLPAINYVVARQITVAFGDSNKVASVTNVDSISGVYIEPKTDSATTAKGKNAPKPAPGKQRPKSIVPLPPIKPIKP
jgi:lipopolysaccharide export system protein LptA